MNSEDDDNNNKKSELKEMIDKVVKHTKNLKLILAKIEAIDKKVDAMKAPSNSEEDATPEARELRDKEKMDKAFEKKGIGRPAGSYENKQQQYLKMLNEGKIKQPKEQTLDYYKIIREDDKYVVV